MLSRDLAFFKERAAQRDQERRSESVERDRRSRNRSPDSDYGRRRRSQGRHGRGHDFVRGATEFGHPEEEEDISDEELERRREERREKDLEIAFKQVSHMTIFIHEWNCLMYIYVFLRKKKKWKLKKQGIDVIMSDVYKD